MVVCCLLFAVVCVCCALSFVVRSCLRFVVCCLSRAVCSSHVVGCCLMLYVCCCWRTFAAVGVGC